MTTTKHNPVVQPYLFFDGCCEEALEYYRKTLGAQVEALMRFKDSPDPGMCAPGAGDKVMHASFRIGEPTKVVIQHPRRQTRPLVEDQGLTLQIFPGDRPRRRPRMRRCEHEQ